MDFFFLFSSFFHFFFLFCFCFSFSPSFFLFLSTFSFIFSSQAPPEVNMVTRRHFSINGEIRPNTDYLYVRRDDVINKILDNLGRAPMLTITATRASGKTTTVYQVLGPQFHTV